MASEKTTLPQEMRAQFLESFKTPYVLRAVPLPKPSSPHDLLVKVDAASYCHTDAVLAEGLMPPNPPSFPHIGCHEFAGTIISVPPSDDPVTSFKVGDRIGVPGRAFNPCGSCFECLDESSPDSDRAGYSVFCPNSGNNGLSRAGGFAEYAVVDARQIAPIPSSMTAVETAPLMCAGVTIYSALKRCQLQPGQRVGIVGCGGGLGHLGLQFASKMGFKVIGLDSADGALKLARELETGARIVDVRTERAEQIVREIGNEDGKIEAGNVGLDAVIILPESQKAFEYGVGLLKNHGKCVVVSFPEAGFHFSARDIVFRDISIVGSLVGSNKTLREMLEFASEHEVRAIVKTFPLSKLNDLVTEYQKGSGGKLVIDMSLEA
ncbi:alcohol dehydrogenase-like protein [Rhexocercosporidium sp. MPI-PUGE-AT-0058]|nr:alcohol dehydrogenase-like protein [Rhexocercosporidium sp. MPI-PUGE-AT-0058]